VEDSGRLSAARGRRTNGRRRRGRTRWEHVSRTEIVNYSFVLRRAGVGRLEERRSEYRTARTEKEKTSNGWEGGPGETVYTYTWQRCTRGRDATRTGGERVREGGGGTFLFHRTVETRACCHEGRRRRVGDRGARERGRGREREREREREGRKTRMRLMIYMPATVYYRVSPSVATIFSSFSSPPLPPPAPCFFSRPLSLSVSSRFLHLGPLTAHDLPYFTRRLRPPYF